MIPDLNFVAILCLLCSQDDFSYWSKSWFRETRPHDWSTYLRDDLLTVLQMAEPDSGCCY